ncbi:MAG: hypothetical protein U0401_36380 [Anaerolineae bacterium]
MTVITVPTEEKILNELLKRAQQNDLILETADGQRFMLVSMETWAGFEVGEEDDFEREVELTGQNQELMRFLGQRRSHGEKTPLAEVKKKLGLK